MDGGMDRRGFVSRAGFGVGALILGGVPVWPDPTLAKRRNRIGFAGDGVFSEGIASGDPGPNGITLWTRLGGHTRDRKLKLVVARDAEFRNVIHRQTVLAQARRDHTLRVRVHGRKLLKPGEQYFYRFFTKRRASEVGRFRTALPPDSREPVRIAFFSCQDWQAGFYGAHQTIAEIEDLDLVVCLGDYIYEQNFYKGPRTDNLGANKDSEVQTLDEYRSKYRLYKSDADLRAMHAAHPFTFVPDDHEVEDNWAGTDPGQKTSHVRVPFLERRANGFAAYAEYMPFRAFPKEHYRFYRKLSLGRNADLLLLDERSYRDLQPCNDRILAPPCGDTNTPGRKFLGAEQKQWLKEELRSSQATWKLVGNQLMVMPFDAPTPGNPAVVDSWDGYEAERAELLDHIRANDIRDVAFLTGDIHAFFAGEVLERARSGNPVATEFVGGSLTSLGLAESVKEEALPSAPFGEDQIKLLADADLPLANPHFRYMNLDLRGYGLVEALPNELLVEFKAVNALVRNTTARTIASFKVRSGDPRVELIFRNA